MRTIRKNEIITKCGYDWPPEIKGDGPFYAINPYVGCAHNCSYCWAKDLTYRFRKPWGIPDDFEWDKPLVVENALELLEKELKTKKPGRVLLSSMTDPYQPLEERLRLTEQIIKVLFVSDFEPMILTRALTLPKRDFGIYAGNAFWFGETITCEGDPRVITLKDAQRRAIATFASLEPWMPGCNLFNIVSANRLWVDFWVIGSLNKAGRAVNSEFYKRELPPLIEWMDKEGIRYYIKKELRRVAGKEATDAIP